MKQPANGSNKLDYFSFLDRNLVKVEGRGRHVHFSLNDQVPFAELEQGLRRYLSDSTGWFSGGSVVVDVGRRALDPRDLARLRGVLEGEYGLRVARFYCDAGILEQAISQEIGVPMAFYPNSGPNSPAPGTAQLPTPREGASTAGTPLVLKGTYRSGTNVRHEGDVLLMGDLNPGAQLVASGDIVVMGTLRGVAHAGYGEAAPPQAVVIALVLRPLQLRIGPYVSVAPAGRARASPTYPEIAFVSGDSIVVTPYHGGTQRSQERNQP